MVKTKQVAQLIDPFNTRLGYQTDTELDTKKEEKTKKQQQPKKKKYRKRRVVKTQDNIKSLNMQQPTTMKARRILLSRLPKIKTKRILRKVKMPKTKKNMQNLLTKRIHKMPISSYNKPNDYIEEGFPEKVKSEGYFYNHTKAKKELVNSLSDVINSGYISDTEEEYENQNKITTKSHRMRKTTKMSYVSQVKDGKFKELGKYEINNSTLPFITKGNIKNGKIMEFKITR